MIFWSLQFNCGAVIESELDSYRYKAMFGNNYITFDCNSIEELVEKSISSLSIKENLNSVCVYLIVNAKGEILFAYFDSKSKCETLCLAIGYGLVVDLNFSSKSKNIKVQNKAASSKAVKQRLIGPDNFITSMIEKGAVNLKDISTVSLNIPEKFSILSAEKKTTEKVTKKEIIRKIDKESSFQTDELYLSLFQSLGSLREIINNIEKQKIALKAIVEACDYETLNLLHTLELDFDKVNACDGYKLSKKIHEIREYRRNAKDKLLIIDELKDLKTLKMLSTLCGLPDKLEDRTYNPRRTFGMFDV